MDIKMLVAAHKSYWMPEDEMYFPIHVGRQGKKDIGFTGDNTGDNISDKNPGYCELTGVYWAWKNLKADYIGLSHYRRYFTARPFFSRIGRDKKSCVLTSAEVAGILRDYDVILPKKRNYYIETNQSHYCHAHNSEDLLKAGQIVREMYPDYAQAYDRVMNSTGAHMFNMFMMKRSCFDSYCQWVFSILKELEKQVDVSGYNPYEARVFGYISELLLDVWIEKNHIRYYELPVMFMENQNWAVKGGRFVARKFSGGPFGKKNSTERGNASD